MIKSFFCRNIDLLAFFQSPLLTMISFLTSIYMLLSGLVSSKWVYVVIISLLNSEPPTVYGASDAAADITTLILFFIQKNYKKKRKQLYYKNFCFIRKTQDITGAGGRGYSSVCGM